MKLVWLTLVLFAITAAAKNVVDIRALLAEPWDDSIEIPVATFHERLNSQLSRDGKPAVLTEDWDYAMRYNLIPKDDVNYVNIEQIALAMDLVLEDVNRHRSGDEKVSAGEVTAAAGAYLTQMKVQKGMQQLFDGSGLDYSFANLEKLLGRNDKWLLLAEAISHCKREAKNVVSLSDLSFDLDDSRGKRDAKNVVDISKLEELGNLNENEKRKNVVDISKLEALGKLNSNDKRKNVVDLSKLEELGHLNENEKRDAKNVVNLAHLEELGHLNDNDKRDAKNVVSLALLDDLKHLNGKRDAKNIVNLADFKFTLDEKKNHKRKHVVNLADLKLELNDKRDAKNVVELSLEELRDRDEPLLADVAKLLHNLKRQQVLVDGKVLELILPQMRLISVFTGYIRDNADVAKLTEQQDQSLLLVAPTDDAVSKMSKKPWEFPREVSGPDADAIAAANVELFLQSHVATSFVYNGGEVETKLMNGHRLVIKQDLMSNVDGGAFSVVVPETNEVIPVMEARQVANGYVLVIDRVLAQP